MDLALSISSMFECSFPLVLESPWALMTSACLLLSQLSSGTIRNTFFFGSRKFEWNNSRAKFFVLTVLFLQIEGHYRCYQDYQQNRTNGDSYYDVCRIIIGFWTAHGCCEKEKKDWLKLKKYNRNYQCYHIWVHSNFPDFSLTWRKFSFPRTRGNPDYNSFVTICKCGDECMILAGSDNPEVVKSAQGN